MTLLLQLLRYNDIAATSIAIFGNLLLLFLILSVKKVAIKGISITLLPNCIMDLIVAFLTLLTQPQILIVVKRIHVVIGSPLYKFGFKAGSVLMWFYGAFMMTSLNAVCVPFCIRYLIICRNIEVKARLVIILYMYLIFLFIILFILMIWCYPMTAYHSNVLMNDFWLDEFPEGPTFVYVGITDPHFFALALFVSIALCFSYRLVVYFSIKMIKKMRMHLLTNIKTKNLSKQLNKALTIQAVGPLVICIPFLCLVLACIFNVDEPWITLSLSFFLGWISVVHPIAAITIIAPYRQRTKQVFGFKEKTQTQVSVIPTTTKVSTKNDSKTSAIPS